ncbi:hypothetical protein E7T09_03895 [Deinococcus sp. KSM4-11]|uniref:hypothetical protein n=1 Tax=Deinococcus sp. KSM4-11 TaxID=2568654 RepID=UPI0010A3814D|nr:hypothetical protein [Deinococcus sp. KSM4-11]THF88357.1 hypothetical protein E7T09_03895 [Deinococcus sp. KSM4-11]
MIRWLDLRVEGDPHPRRFDTLEATRAYLLRVERLSDEAVTLLTQTGDVGPPVARRTYHLRRLTPE